MEYTRQERKNFRGFILSFLLLILSLALIIIGSQKELFLFGIIGILLAIFTQLWMFYIGYSHGWELKRIEISKN